MIFTMAEHDGEREKIVSAEDELKRREYGG